MGYTGNAERKASQFLMRTSDAAAYPLVPGSVVQEAAVPVSTAKIEVHSKPSLTCLVLFLSDLFALVAAAVICVQVRLMFDGQYHPSLYWQLWPVLSLFLLGYASVGLYPGAPLSPPDEIRRVFSVTSIVYLAMGTLTFFGRDANLYSRLIFLCAWFLSIFLVLSCRATVRLMFSHQKWWGCSAIIVGAGTTGRAVVKLLARQPNIGLKPLAMLDQLPSRRPKFGNTPILSEAEIAPILKAKNRRVYAILALPDLPNQTLTEQLEKYEHCFGHVMVIPDLSGITTLGVAAQDLGGMLGLQVRQRLLDPGRLAIKRTVEVLLIALFSPIIILLMSVIALIVKLDSRGPMFFGHTRIGMGGRKFKAWKFRSMVHNADATLEAYLKAHPELRQEWERTQKLKNDPRMTRFGRVLRLTSLDELPQLWNVIVGEMSLVGPRPIIESEIPRYGQNIKMYKRVRPGLTGLWQVSGRNNMTYFERIRLDVYYVRNWSVWLDLHILAKTIRPVLFGDGAY